MPLALAPRQPSKTPTRPHVTHTNRNNGTLLKRIKREVLRSKARRPPKSATVRVIRLKLKATGPSFKRNLKRTTTLTDVRSGKEDH